MLVKVKICGLTRYRDAKLAADLGAWGLGFIFVESSPRACSVEKATDICRQLPENIEKVGVFLNETAERVNEICDQVGLTIAQLHGLETPDYCKQIKRPVLKAIQNLDLADTAQLEEYGCTLLMDAPRVGDEWGGTGHKSDWAKAREIARRYPLFLAGNLGESNVLQAIAEVQPMGIDLSSSIESSPGIKDELKLRQLFNTLAQID